MFEDLLKTKKHNPLYLIRYIRFIRRYQEKKYTIGEKHHILPKSKDMFPEYKDFSKNSWNCVTLPLKAHFYAHYLLSKSYKHKSQLMAFCLMGGRMVDKGMLFLLKEYEKGKNDRIKTFSKMRKGTVSAKNLNTGENVIVTKEQFENDDLLVGVRLGMGIGMDNVSKRIEVKNKISYKKKGMISVIFNGKHIQIRKIDFDKNIHTIHSPLKNRNNIIIIMKSGDKKSCEKTDQILNTNNFIYNNQKWILKIKTKFGEILFLNNKNYIKKFEVENGVKFGRIERIIPNQYTDTKCGLYQYTKVPISEFFK